MSTIAQCAIFSTPPEPVHVKERQPMPYFFSVPMRYFFSVAIASTLMGTGGLLAGPASAAGPVPGPPSLAVNVTNTSSSPVPVAAQGITSVSGSVSVSGAVSAAQSGNWSVGITGNADEPGRNPFQQTLEFSANPPSACRAIPASPQVCDFEFPAIPVGKRLVVTNVTGLIFVDQPGVVGRIEFLPGPTVGSTFLGTYPNSGFGGSENMIGVNAPVLFFVDAGTFLRLRVNASAPVAVDNNGTVGSSITISGYFVNL